MRVERQPRFLRAYRKLTTAQRNAVDAALLQFIRDPRYPPLHFEKLVSDLHSIRVDIGMRIVLRRIKGDHFALLDVGSHDVQDRYGQGRKK